MSHSCRGGKAVLLCAGVSDPGGQAGSTLGDGPWGSRVVQHGRDGPLRLEAHGDPLADLPAQKGEGPDSYQLSRPSGIAPVHVSGKAAGRSVPRILPAAAPGCQAPLASLHVDLAWPGSRLGAPGEADRAGTPENGPERRKPRPGGGRVARTLERGSCRPSGPPAGP